MSAPSIDLEAYFARIGLVGSRKPTLGTLRELIARHTEAIPFENLSPFLGEGVKLDIDALQDKLVRRGRGGYCFEQNLLFSQVLRQVGFDVTWLAARVRWNVPAGVVTARTHMVLHVQIGAENYLADVGFGGQTPTAPINLETAAEQPTPHEAFRLSSAGDAYLLEAKLEGDWQALYVFDLQEQQLADYEVANWYISNHPRSTFVVGLVAARSAPLRRHALRNARYSLYHRDGETEQRILTSVEEFKETLQRDFRIRLPKVASLEDKLSQLIETTQVT